MTKRDKDDETKPEDGLLSPDDFTIESRSKKNLTRITIDEQTRKIHGEIDVPEKLHHEMEMSERVIVDRLGFFHVMQLLAPQSNLNSDRKRFYFRGEASSEFNLLPSLLRDGVYDRLTKLHGALGPIDLQKKLLDRFRRYTQHLIHSDNDFNAPIWDDFDTLCLAQHYGLPTLLMDWTLNPYVAAYFAISEAYKTLVREKLSANRNITKYWVRVWVMRLKQPSERRDFTVHLEDRKKEWDKFLGDMMLAPSAPLIVVPLVFTRRIAAQAGRFVYCGYIANEFDDDNPSGSKSIASFSWVHKKKNTLPKKSKLSEELGWDQLYSLDIEFDIDTPTPEPSDSSQPQHWKNAKDDLSIFNCKLAAFRAEMMKMMSDLEFIGFHAGRLFPDLEGWARYLAEGNL